jgi:hypothetical protein
LSGPSATCICAAAALAAASLFAVACGTPSDEALIRGLLKEAVALAEHKDTRGLQELFAPDYADFEGRDVDGTLRLIAEYLDTYKGVVIHLLSARVGDIQPDGRASVECEVSLSHGAAEVLRKLIRYTGEYYRFEIEVRKIGPGEWRFSSAGWRSIGLADLFPESLEILKKLFPGL